MVAFLTNLAVAAECQLPSPKHLGGPRTAPEGFRGDLHACFWLATLHLIGGPVGDSILRIDVGEQGAGFLLLAAHLFNAIGPFSSGWVDFQQPSRGNAGMGDPERERRHGRVSHVIQTSNAMASS